MNRKNALFAESDGGGQYWPVIETCKLVEVEPHAYLTEVMTRIVEGHPQRRPDDLLSSVYAATLALKAVA